MHETVSASPPALPTRKRRRVRRKFLAVKLEWRALRERFYASAVDVETPAQHDLAVSWDCHHPEVEPGYHTAIDVEPYSLLCFLFHGTRVVLRYRSTGWLVQLHDRRSR